jgi:urease alpha subunit
MQTDVTRLQALRRRRRDLERDFVEANRLDRNEALRRYTVGSAWFSGEEEKKGSVEVGKLADLAVFSADYFSVPEPEMFVMAGLLCVGFVANLAVRPVRKEVFDQDQLPSALPTTRGSPA